MSKHSLPLIKPALDKDKLVHRLYDAVVDNSLWPEMVSELIEHIEYHRRVAPGDKHYLADLTTHFERAFQLSEKIVNLQEQNSALASVLDSFSMGVMLYDHGGQLVYANEFAGLNDLNLIPFSDLRKSALSSSTAEKTAERPHIIDKTAMQSKLQVSENINRVAFIPVKNLKTMRLPANIETLVLYLPTLSEGVLDHVKQRYYLSQSESQFLATFYRVRNLKIAAIERDLTYETARTYFKKILFK